MLRPDPFSLAATAAAAPDTRQRSSTSGSTQGCAMAKDGLLALLCASALGATLLLSTTRAAPGDDRDSLVAATLAVQTAMQQGRDYMLRNDSKSAVQVLEAQLPRINGNAAYLTLLRDAYRARIKELRLAGQEAEAQRYMERLQVLDPGAVLDGSLVRGANAPAQSPAPVPAKPVAAVPPPRTEARGKIEEEDDPFRPSREDKAGKARSLVARAESEFGSRHYKEAGVLFEQAHQADANATAASLDRWAYCKLHRVVQQLNQPSADGPSLAELEQQTRQAMTMAPKLEYAKSLLVEIDKRKTAPGARSQITVAVRHYERDSTGWACAETANFRVYHTQPREVAEQTAQIAERTRTAIAGKWFGGFKEDWNPRCDIYLYPTAQEYSQATGVAAASPGHSTIRNNGSRIISRRIDLHCEDPKRHCEDPSNMLTAVLPHEATHVIIAGQFGEQQIPRWADEGMAVLSEPRDRIDRHLHNLPICQSNNLCFPVKQLLTMPDYPEPRYVTAFYAESVSVVDFLASLKGPQEFSLFLREAQKIGYEASLQKHYGYKGFDDFQQQWGKKVFAGAEEEDR
jgi:hypothetical protein